ncbi:family 1 glycosylhydrolase [Nocardia terpenica]|uniref:Family 1 glycosylhydrolase n=1 Tax=Nocardia terpenica TaxID=455432 RepID=A0A6G9Z904_9NOCA|nr:family 1 glycosylhydrolase [Nocardia terpenica]QIS21944.1 family 1 glycosylhydrolase [Nocardia terpenica]
MDAASPESPDTPTAAASEPPTSVTPFGPEFLWGVATSGFQSEGHAPDSNWIRYIKQSGYEAYGDSIDFYDRYASDIALARAMGLNVFRISIEWARVQPKPGEWDEAGFAFYDSLIDAIMAAGMRPMLTLDHWVYPGWKADQGGWNDAGMVADWLTNAHQVVDRYAPRKPLWVTVNEPVAYIVHEEQQTGITGPVIEPLIAAVHNGIYDYIHQVQPDALVTSNIGYVAGSETQVNGPMVDRIKDKLDYIGVDYYYGADDPDAPPPGNRQIWELPLQPEGVYYALRHYARQFPDKPLYVVENGMPTENGRPRPDGYDRADYLRDVVYWLQRARMDGMNIIGYNYWSLTDNYEWGSYTPRFGLHTVNVDSDPALTRIPTDAVDAYRGIVAAGGVAPDYLPTRPPVARSYVDPPSSYEEPVTLPTRNSA